MRINKFIAQATGSSRRAADAAIAEGRVQVNGTVPTSGHDVIQSDSVTLDGKVLVASQQLKTVLLNKPVGYVCSRDGQGSRTVYDLLPPVLHVLKPVGRLDKDSSGLLLLTNDGDLAQTLTHPRYQKTKVYHVTLDKPLQPLHRQMINDYGIQLPDGNSRLLLQRLHNGDESGWQITMTEGRNRQIRRTFEALGYTVGTLHRTVFGPYKLGALKRGLYATVPQEKTV